MIPEQLLERALANPEAAAAIVTGVVAGAGHYRRTGRLPIGRLPLRALRGAWGELAERYFGRDRPTGVPGLLVDTNADALEYALRNRHFESADDVSFEYAGELGNYRRPNGARSHPDTGEPVPMELHPRTFETADGRLLVLTHDEASRAEAWGAHLDGSLLSWERGVDAMAAVLDDVEGVTYERIESERAAGADVVE